MQSTPDELAAQRSRVERLTKLISTETINLTPGERTRLFGNLAKIWKAEDPNLAKKYLRNAVEEATPALTDDRNARAKKIGWLRKLLPLSAQIDPKVTDEIIGQLKSEDSEPNQALQNSIALTQTAQAIVNDNPVAAAEFTVAAMMYLERPSQNEKIFDIILLLGTKDKEVSETLFLRVLRVAQETSDTESFARLALFTSPDSTTLKLDFLSVGTKKAVLTIFLEALTKLTALWQQKQLPEPRRVEACGFLLIGKGLEQIINTHLPQQSATISQINQSGLCQQAVPSAQSATDEVISSRQKLSIDELIQAGESATDPTRKALFFSLAVGKLAQGKNYEKALEVLDEMDDVTRRAMGVENDDEFWTVLRENTALEAVVQKLERKDFAAATRIIEKTPGSSRTSLQIKVGRAILAKTSQLDVSSAEQAFALGLITDARRNLASITDSFSSVDLYLSLIHRFAVLLPDELPSLFGEAMKAINRADKLREDKSFQGKDFANGEDVIRLPLMSIEREATFLEQIAGVQNSYTRVRLKLGLLNASMTKYAAEKRKSKPATD